MPEASEKTESKTESKTENTAGDDFTKMSREQFNTRLHEAGQTAVRTVLKELGFEKVEDAKARLTKAGEIEKAQMSELDRAKATAKELSSKAANADRYETAIKSYLEAEEKAVPDAKRDLLDLAPPATDPAARLDWISKAKAKGVFNVTSPAETKTETKTDAKPANSIAGNGNPPAPKNGTAKSPLEMTAEEYAKFKAEQLTSLGSQ